MSLLKANGVQFGQSGTATNNFTLSVPSSPDGTIKLARGNSGATTADVVNIDSSGNVGIGATSFGAYRLNIEGNSASVGVGILLNDTNASGRLHTIRSDAGTLAIYDGTAGADRLRIDSSGRVGINVTSPLYRLQVDGDVGLTDTSSLYWATAGGTTRTSITGDSSGNLKLQTGSSNTERLRIDSSGNVGIGDTNPSSADHKLVIKHSHPTSGGGGISINQLVSGTGRAVQFVYQTNTQVGSITVTNSATAYNTSSDYRLKTNIEQLSSGISRIKQLPVYRFNWLADIDGNKVDGFIAHEVQAVVPECINGNKDAMDADGNPIYQGIDQSKLVPLLTAAIKEAIAKIETIEAKVTALEAA